MGVYLCQKCQNQISFRAVCPPPPSFDGRLSLFRYDGVIKEIIQSLKFDFVTDLVEEFSMYVVAGMKVLYPSILSYWRTSGFVIVPIPLHPKRENWRGFNQSSLIAKSLSEKLELGYSSDLLLRTKNTSPQSSIHDKKFRLTNINSAFSLNSAASNLKLPDKIILFDDVHTTGSTLSSAASLFPTNTHKWLFTLA